MWVSVQSTVFWGGVFGTTDRRKKSRDGGGKHVSSGFLWLFFLSLTLSLPPSSVAFLVLYWSPDKTHLFASSSSTADDYFLCLNVLVVLFIPRYVLSVVIRLSLAFFVDSQIPFFPPGEIRRSAVPSLVTSPLCILFSVSFVCCYFFLFAVFFSSSLFPPLVSHLFLVFFPASRWKKITLVGVFLYRRYHRTALLPHAAHLTAGVKPSDPTAHH